MLRIKSTAHQGFFPLYLLLWNGIYHFGVEYSLMNHSCFSHASATEEHLYPGGWSKGSVLERMEMTQAVIGWTPLSLSN